MGKSNSKGGNATSKDTRRIKWVKAASMYCLTVIANRKQTQQWFHTHQEAEAAE